jgi:threonine dehydrogenase-like Zn-dependent dehydrogenase
MRAAVIRAPGDYGLVARPAPPIGRDELVLAPVVVGICRTDIELFDGTMVYLRTGRTRLPLTPGHEWVADVAAVGADVRDFAVGQRVVGECSIGCGTCPLCLRGDYHQCPARRETGVMNLDGAMSGYFSFPARAAHALPTHLNTEDAVFAEPTAVALRAVLRAAVQPGEQVLVVGGGTIGWLVTALVLDLCEAEVACSEPDVARLQRLEALGARCADAGDTFDVVIEASGTPGGVSFALGALADGGRFVGVGLTGMDSVGIDLDRIVVRDQTLIGSLGSPGVWPQAIGLLGHGRLRPSSIVTERHPLADFASAVATMRKGSAGAGKSLVVIGDEDRQ